MPFVSQAVISSATVSALARTEYLSYLSHEIDTIINDYHNENPQGEDYTLKVFQSLGKDRSLSVHDSEERAKQDIGLLVAQRLVNLFSAEAVSTERRGNSSRTFARPNHDESTNDWLKSYTRHKVKEMPKPDIV